MLSSGLHSHRRSAGIFAETMAKCVYSVCRAREDLSCGEHHIRGLRSLWTSFLYALFLFLFLLLPVTSSGHSAWIQYSQPFWERPSLRWSSSLRRVRVLSACDG